MRGIRVIFKEKDETLGKNKKVKIIINKANEITEVFKEIALFLLFNSTIFPPIK
ncbi:hypothetical protein JCM31447_11440 [Fluviispira sanaruensis]|uniref:Uncharacterized protein n=1 Tax=Fluviispira sanaruensis TaxID=2493639 RepID=A0A4P2VUY8_FLUSA|nr:hypothetical protein JCM31447_11440 [Fluviispira sanaruensis]